MLKVEQLSVSYRGFDAVRGLSFEVQPGQWLMLTGPNGAGKSSLLSAIAQTVPSQGRILLSGQDARKLPAKELARRLAVLRQGHSLGYSFTVEELVSLGRYAHQTPFSHKDLEGKAKVEEALALCGLTEKRKQSALTLSGGEMQRAFLAQVLAQDSPLLLLDEPASYLDLHHQQSLFELIALWLTRPGRAVVSVVHDLLLARRFGSHALLMHKGSCLAAGTLDEVFAAENLSRAFNMDVDSWFSWLYAPWTMDKMEQKGYTRPNSERDDMR